VNARFLVSIVNLAAIAVAFVVVFELPQYASYAFYALLVWIVVGFTVSYFTGWGRSSRARATSSASGPGGADSATAGTFPSATLPSAPFVYDFCIYCGTTLPPGATTCPACGHGVATPPGARS
jgi:hypothetical protein